MQNKLPTSTKKHLTNVSGVRYLFLTSKKGHQMSYTLLVVSDAGKTIPAGPIAGQSAEKVSEFKYPTIGEAITNYERYRDHGFAIWERTASIISEEGEVLVSKTLKRPEF